MADREKVIKGLQQFISDFKPYCGNEADWGRVFDVLELLKEQEPVEPKWRKGYAYCGQCGYRLHWIVDRNNFCPNCGRKVKWGD